MPGRRSPLAASAAAMLPWFDEVDAPTWSEGLCLPPSSACQVRTRAESHGMWYDLQRLIVADQARTPLADRGSPLAPSE